MQALLQDWIEQADERLRDEMDPYRREMLELGRAEAKRLLQDSQDDSMSWEEKDRRFVAVALKFSNGGLFDANGDPQD